MARFKKYSQRFLCILSSCVCFIMAVFYPFEEFRADESLKVNGTLAAYEFVFDVSYPNFGSDTGNTSIPNRTTVSFFDHPAGFVETIETTQFYRYLYGKSLFVSKNTVYAYKFDFGGRASFNLEQTEQIGYMIGTSSDMENLSGTFVPWEYSISNSDTFWYVTNYQDVTLYAYLYGLFYEESHTSSEGQYTNYPSVTGTVNYGIRVTPYTVDDLTDEIYATLNDIYATDTQMLTQLENIYNSVDTVETKLQNLYNIANSQLSYLKEIDANTDELESLMKVCNSYLANIQSELEEQTTWLEKIYNAIIEFLGLEGEESMEEMPSDDMNDLTVQKDELLGDASTDDLASDLTVSIDTDSNSFIWDVINDFVTANSTVFGGFISILSLGVLALILNR